MLLELPHIQQPDSSWTMGYPICGSMCWQGAAGTNILIGQRLPAYAREDGGSRDRVKKMKGRMRGGSIRCF